MIEVPLAFAGPVIACLIRKQTKDDPNNASGSASGYRTDTHTHKCTMSVLLSFPRNTEEQTQTSPLITIKTKTTRGRLFCKNQNRFGFLKPSFTWASARVRALSSVLFSFLSKQVLGPPAAGAYRQRPARPTSFRKSYERRELPVALLHDTKGQQIAWKVGVLPFADHTLHTPLGNVMERDGMIGLHLSTKRQPLMAKFNGV